MNSWIKNTFLLLSLFASSMTCASPWASFCSWGTCLKALFFSSSHNNSTKPCSSSVREKIEDNYGKISLLTLTGYCSYRLWRYKITNGTDSLAEAISKENGKAIRYWLGKTNKSNVDTLGCIAPANIKVGPRMATPLEAAIVRGRKDIIQKLLEFKPNPNLIVDGHGLQWGIHKDPTILPLLLSHDLDPKQKYRILGIDPNHNTRGLCRNAPLIVPHLLHKDRGSVFTLLSHGADFDVNSGYCTSGDKEYFDEDQKQLFQEASTLVKRKHLAGLATITGKEQQVFPNEKVTRDNPEKKPIRDIVASFLTCEDTHNFSQAFKKQSNP